MYNYVMTYEDNKLIEKLQSIADKSRTNWWFFFISTWIEWGALPNAHNQMAQPLTLSPGKSPIYQPPQNQVWRDARKGSYRSDPPLLPPPLPP